MVTLARNRAGILFGLMLCPAVFSQQPEPAKPASIDSSDEL
jgi:hypothetical protein